MNTHSLRTSIAALLLAAAGHAQSTQLRANIPFNFVAGGATFNAGQYTVDQSHSGLIAVRSANGKGSAFLFAATGQCGGAQSTSRLVFNRYGNALLLSQIWTRGDNCDREVRVTRRDRELATRQKAPDETVVLAVR